MRPAHREAIHIINFSKFYIMKTTITKKMMLVLGILWGG